MGQFLRKFIHRAPRYVLRPSDNKILRFAKANEKSLHTTELVNLSATGAAFLVERDCVPALGDYIKVEFSIPGDGQVAWFARVVRMEEYTRQWWSVEKSIHDLVVVGVKFDQLRPAQQKTMEKNIDRAFDLMVKEHRRRRRQAFYNFLKVNMPRILFYTFCAVFTFAFLYYISRPSQNYDSHRGAPWGERYKFWGN